MSNSRMEELFEQAVSRHKEGQYEAAVKIWRGILVLRPDDIPALNNLAIALRHLGRIAESEAVLRTGLERAPASTELWISLSRTLTHWGVSQEAEAALQKAEILAPDNPRPAYALGRLYEKQGNLMAAMAQYQKALDLKADFPPALLSLARGWKKRGQAAQSRALLEQLVTINPAHSAAQHQLAMIRIAAGDFTAGWRGFEWRLALDGLEIIDPGLPRWQGEPLQGRRLLIRAEQGFSEILQFARLLRLVKNGEVIFQCPDALQPLLNGSRIADEVIAESQPAPPADFWLPLLSLPAVLNLTLDTLTPAKPYLRADPSRLAPWRKKLGPGPAIGIAWCGSSPPHENRTRKIPLRAFAPLANLPDVQLISLQKGEGRDEIAACGFPLVDFGNQLDEGEGAFLDTAALMQGLTCVVSVDSAIAHLAGALGRPGKILLPDLLDWRWATAGQAVSPWYNSLQLYAQNDADWSRVIENIARDIAL